MIAHGHGVGGASVGEDHVGQRCKGNAGKERKQGSGVCLRVEAHGQLAAVGLEHAPDRIHRMRVRPLKAVRGQLGLG